MKADWRLIAAEDCPHSDIQESVSLSKSKFRDSYFLENTNPENIKRRKNIQSEDSLTPAGNSEY